jgi:NitT/TauT family transport system substrate-binding protein
MWSRSSSRAPSRSWKPCSRVVPTAPPTARARPTSPSARLPQPGTFKIFCSNPSNVKNVLDEVIVPVASPAKVMADLKGKRIGSGPGIQNVTLAKTVLERGGATGATVVELPIGQHVAALAAGQIDGAYTLEPTGTIGRMNGTTGCSSRA